jgi:hypothetical protein
MGNPKFKWIPLLAHLGVATIFAWVVQGSTSLHQLFTPVTVQFASWIPSIAGYAAMSSDPGFTRAFLMAAWIGVPCHVLQWAKIMPPVLGPWVHQQSPIGFWMKIVIFIVLVLGSLMLPSIQYQPTDATQSVRATAWLVSLMKESFPVLLLVSFSLVFVCSFLLATVVVGGYLRLFAADDYTGSMK